MKKSHFIKRRSTVVILLLGYLFTACNDEPAPTVAPIASLNGVTATPNPVGDVGTMPISPTATAVPPTPTPTEPMAALVNDEPIFLATYEKELARYEQAQVELGNDVVREDYRSVVLDALIERALIHQAAAAQGITVVPEMVDAQLAELRAAAGDDGNFEAWLEANQLTEAEFREEVRAGLITERMVATVTAGVPSAVEQVRARYIQVDDAALADTLLVQIQHGGDFASLAQEYSLDRATGENGGDLGFFAPGSLLVPEVETAAFALQQPGDVTDIITVTGSDGQVTYYLVQLIERDPQRPLLPDMRFTLLQQTFNEWLNELWAEATIVRFVETDT